MTLNDFFISTISGGIIGGFASYIASIKFMENNNKNHRPIIDVSDKLIQSSRVDGTPSLVIKVINKTDQDIADVRFEIEGVKNLSPAGHIPLLNLVLLGKRDILYIKRFDKDDNDAHFAHRTNLFKENGDILSECSKYEKIRVSIKTICPYYGTSLVLSKDYDVIGDILGSNYSFNTGNSLAVSSH